MQNTKESIVSLTIPSGSSTGSVDFTPPNGRVIGCVVYHNNAANTGFVRVAVKDNTGQEISMLQSIENYRSREAGYIEGTKPLNVITGGRTFTYQVVATQNFTANHNSELIFIYEQENC